MAKDILRLDYETFSMVDLKKVGGGNYFRDPSTEALMVAYEFNGGPIEQISYAEGEDESKWFQEAMIDPDVEKWAWNAPFEIGIRRHTQKQPVDLRQWRDTMVLAAYCSFPMQLEKAGPALGFPEEECKMPQGKVLMRRFSFPWKPTKTMPNRTRINWWDDPVRWNLYLEYNRRDVAIEGKIGRRLMRHNWEPLWEQWVLDQEINERGLPINLNMVRNANAVYETAYEIGFNRMRELTGLDNPMSGQQLIPWLIERGYPFSDLKKGHVQRSRAFIDNPPDMWSDEEVADYQSDDAYREVLDLRLELSRTSIKKYDALERATHKEDSVIRGTLQFYGAMRTGRWGGRIFQPQNLARPNPEFEEGIQLHAEHVEKLTYEQLSLLYHNLFDLLASTIRPAAQAPEGYLFADADLNAIENRVLGWLARCDKILDVFRNGRDPYIDFATYLFDTPYDVLWAEYKAGDKSKRTIAKPGVLGCGYMLGAGKERENYQTGEMEATGLLGYAWDMHVKHFTLADSELSVETFRREFKEVKDYWYDIERECKTCVKYGETVEFDHLTFDMTDDDFLRMRLPSGRHLHYYKPRLQKKMMPWGKEKLQITYEGVNDKKQWVRMGTHPGKLTENADQAISRDLLMHGMKLALENGLDVRLHVHDQNVALVREETADKDLELLQQCMEDRPSWAPDLPLGSGGFTSKVFKKD